jgi:leucyl-tRNA synthetase
MLWFGLGIVQCSVVGTQLIDNETIFPLELNTMPGWAEVLLLDALYGCAQYENEFASKEALPIGKAWIYTLGSSNWTFIVFSFLEQI